MQTMRLTALAVTLAIFGASGCAKKEATSEAAPAEATTVAAVEEQAPAPAAEPAETARVVSILLMVDENGVAVNGYDPVSYFSGAPAPGDPAISSIVDGAEYRFASAENKAAFDADPKAFQPQFGGYCAYGVAEGAKFRTDPATGTVVNGKLYFNKNPDVQRQWNENRDALITKADAAWYSSVAYAEPKD